MIITREMRAKIRAAANEKADREIAATFRERHGDEVAHLADDDLVAAIGHARQVASSLRITQADLRMRFIMLGVLRLPRFWESPEVWHLLTAPTGTPEGRFGDVCAMIRVGAERSGKGDGIWWA